MIKYLLFYPAFDYTDKRVILSPYKIADCYRIPPVARKKLCKFVESYAESVHRRPRGYLGQEFIHLGVRWDHSYIEHLRYVFHKLLMEHTRQQIMPTLSDGLEDFAKWYVEEYSKNKMVSNNLCPICGQNIY